MENAQESANIQLGANIYALFTKGEVILNNVPANKLGEIVRAASVLGNSVEYVKFIGVERDGNIVFCNLAWCQIFVAPNTTSRRSFFSVMLDRNIVECKPDNDVFEELKIVFK